MAVRGVAKRYAQAAFDIARESNTVEVWLRDLTRLAEADADGVTGEFFTSPNVPVSTKRAAVDQLLPDADQQYVRNLAYMLIERRRFDILPDMLEVFRDMMLESQGIAIANVTTAVDLTPAEREQIKTQLKNIVGKDIELRAHTDPSLIGGLVARIGDQLIDGSVISQLHQMRAALAR
jgi:F-type H+-transporting ATPase subunit delta